MGTTSTPTAHADFAIEAAARVHNRRPPSKNSRGDLGGLGSLGADLTTILDGLIGFP